MSRRGRALAFFAGAVVFAALAAALAGGYERSVSEQLGDLRPVLVASERIPARRMIGPRQAQHSLEVRRVPLRFAPPGALTGPAEAIGMKPVASLAPGAYVLAEALVSPRREGPKAAIPSRGLSPLELEVSGAGALASSTGARPSRVDVVVTSEPGPGARGRTYVAAENVELLSIAEGGEGIDEGEDPLAASAAGPLYTATLAVAREDALRLIQAENFARQVRLIPARED